MRWCKRYVRTVTLSSTKGIPRLLQNIAVSKHDVRYHKLIAPLIKCEVLIMNNFLISPMTREEQQEILEIVEDRYDRKSCIITSHLPVKAWHGVMQDPTLANSITVRLVNNALQT